MVDRSAARERQTLLVDLETEFARFRKARKIGAETVAQIHHRVDRKVFREPARFDNARHKSQMFPLHRAAEPAGHEKIVARFAAAARHPAILLHIANDADRNHRRPARAARFAADNADIESRRGSIQSAIDFFHPIAVVFFGTIRVTRANCGTAEMAAKSLNGRIIAFQPTSTGFASG